MSQHEAPAVQPSAPASAPKSGQDRFLLAIVAGTILLVVVSILVVFVFGRGRSSPPPDPHSPAGVVHTYVESVRNAEIEQSRTHLTREARAQAEARERQNPNVYRPSRSDDNSRIVVETVEQTEASAEVKVTVSRFYARSDPFSSSTSHSNITVRLIREDGAWRITQPIEPYLLS